MSYEVIREYTPLFFKAFLLTVKIGWLGICLAFVLGIACAFAIYYKVPFLSALSKCYVELFRNTPLLVQLFFIYYGLPAIGIRIPADVCGTLGLGLLGGSYMAESIRSGLEAVPLIQSESAISLGMSKGQIFRLVIWPQALALSVPGL
ncbi:MAG: ABC transporter permease subunit, partial [Lachnospiraceae bacterium]|nr:ABC transporter permease subunit [Lachnospiraceae bacterium]